MEPEPNKQDLLLLNALVDGELAPAERATLAGRLAVERDLARAYATLARLKATIGEAADASAGLPAFELPPRKTKTPRRWIAYGAALAALLALGFFVATQQQAEPDNHTPEGPTAITLASLPVGTTVPRLDTAGLQLIGLDIDPGKVPLVTATYRGPHGCRLDLRAWPAGAAAPAQSGTDRHRWTAGGLVYELTAHGMPQARFHLIAGAAEAQTAANSDHRRIDRQLREASLGAPPCAG
ncbi:MAG: hypothetical protein WC670_17450 [Pseudolabrys sp.]|jgi:anti-sigma factor RsiW